MLQAAFVFALIGLAFFGAYRATTPECCLLTDAVDKLFRLGGVSLILRSAPTRNSGPPACRADSKSFGDPRSGRVFQQYRPGADIYHIISRAPPLSKCSFDRRVWSGLIGDRSTTKLAGALQAHASRRHPGWASQRTFRLDAKVRRAIETALKE